MAIVESEAVRGQADWPCSSVRRVRRIETEGRMVEVWWGMTRGKIEGVKGTRRERQMQVWKMRVNKKGRLHSQLSEAFRGYIFIQLTRATIISHVCSTTVAPTLVLPARL